MRISAMCVNQVPLGDLSIDPSIITFVSSIWTFNTTATRTCLRPFEEPVQPTVAESLPPI
jgi:hypothetical protein